MNVLVIGNGGREHALCHGIKNSNSCDNLFCVPGSDGIAQIANCFNINISDHILILNFCVENKIDLMWLYLKENLSTLSNVSFFS